VKIVVITPVLNEEDNIVHFCQNYDFADAILVSDGGCTDETIALAKQFSNVKVREFKIRIPLPRDPVGFMNPEPHHYNFLVDWAEEEGYDWLILDGNDCWPNPLLRRDARRILEETKEPAIYLCRIYLWLNDQWFPRMSQYGTSNWAWRRGSITARCDEHNMTFFESAIPVVPKELARELVFPYCCLHYNSLTEDRVKARMERYKAWRPHIQPVHPLKSIYAPAESLPDWVFKLD